MKFNLSGYVVNDTTTIRLRVDKEDLMIFLSKIIDPDDPKALYRDHDVFYDGPYKYKGRIEDKHFILRLLLSSNTHFPSHQFVEGEIIPHTNGVAIKLTHHMSKFEKRAPIVFGTIISFILGAFLINKFIMHHDFNEVVMFPLIYFLLILFVGNSSRSSRLLDMVKRDFYNFAEYKLHHKDNNYFVLGKL